MLDPVVAEPLRLDGLLTDDPALVEFVLLRPSDVLPPVPPVAPLPQGRPLAPMRPVLEFTPVPLDVVPLLAVPGLDGLLGFPELAELPAVLGLDVPGEVALGFMVL